MSFYDFDYEWMGTRVTFSETSRTLVITDYDADAEGVSRTNRVGASLPPGDEAVELARLILRHTGYTVVREEA